MSKYPRQTPFIILILLCLLTAVSVSAHEARPVYVQITETSSGMFLAQWKIPASTLDYGIPVLVMPDTCRERGEIMLVQYPDHYIGQQEYSCEYGLSGLHLNLHFPVINPSVTSIFRVKLLNGEIHSHILKPGVSSWRVPDKENLLRVAGEYLILGMQHIFAGIDHLLFVACLVFIARTPRRILITVTGFTLAHSLTLALSTLRIIELPVPPVEAVIALSIIFLAHEIAIADRQSWTWNYPATVSTSFGLLHGFGFAAVLRAIGLPQTELPAALLFFNIGVEIGQIIFIGMMAAAVITAGRIRILSFLSQRKSFYAHAAAYVIGITASFWFVERVMKFWN